jgi:protein gp37
MAVASDIEWTEATWNPVTGCTKTSPGCAHCYAERMAHRLQAMGQPNYRYGFEITTHAHMLKVPLSWRAPRRVFVNSMGDLFHEQVPESFIMDVFQTMLKARQHIFQVLTKRADRLAALDGKLPWASHVWAGVSVENADYAFRIDRLRDTGSAIKFLSIEPLLGALPNLNLDGIDWVIVGGESGPGARPMKKQWVLDIRDQCLSQGVPFFFKQWGGVRRKKNGRTLEGRTWDEMPKGEAMYELALSR